MNPHLILVRHAAVQIDPAVSSHQWQLTEDARSACHTLAQKLVQYEPSRVFTSHEAKAGVTGQIIANQLVIPCAAVEGLQEHNRQGVPYFGDKATFETAVANFFTHPNELVFGQETAVQARSRFETAVTTLCQTHAKHTLLLTSHGTVMTIFIQYFNPPLDASPFGRSLKMPEAIILSLPDFSLINRLTASS
jgi:broad specificity phosphatase PhoE